MDVMSWDEIEDWYECNGYMDAAAAIDQIIRYGNRHLISNAIQMKSLKERNFGK
jgi:hypothetical protein